MTGLVGTTDVRGYSPTVGQTYFPIGATIYSVGFGASAIELIREISGPSVTGNVNTTGYAAQIIIGQVRDILATYGQVGVTGLQQAINMYRTARALVGQANAEGYAPGITLFKSGAITVNGQVGTVNVEALQAAVGLHRTGFGGVGTVTAEGYSLIPPAGLVVAHAIVGVMEATGFEHFVDIDKYFPFVGNVYALGYRPTIKKGFWSPIRRKATQWASA